jgi:hypothetical protein
VESDGPSAHGAIGPRMSLALLCAEGTLSVPFVERKYT